MIAKHAIPPFLTESLPYVPPRGDIVNPTTPPLRKLKMKCCKKCVCPLPFSQDNGNQIQPEHKKMTRSKVVFHQRSSSTESLLSPKVIFHQRPSSTKGHLPLKVVFTEGCLPMKVVFKLTLPLTAYWNLVILRGGASEAPPKISRKEPSLTPCCYIAFVCLYKKKNRMEISKSERDFRL